MTTVGVALVLDNCEHLVRGSAQLVDYLLQDCAKLSVLATSREALWYRWRDGLEGAAADDS